MLFPETDFVLQRRMIEAALLDVDGTLVNSNDAHANAWCDAFRSEGLSVSFDAIRGWIGMGGDHLLPHVLDVDAEPERAKRVSERRAEIFKNKYLDTIEAFPRARDWIERMLADGLTLVVATSASREDLEALLRRGNLADLLKTFTTSDEAERSKPDPDVVTSALKKSGVSAHQAVMVGDTPYDLQAAARAGVPAIAFTSGGWPAEKLDGALAVYDGPEHLWREYDQSPFRR